MVKDSVWGIRDTIALPMAESEEALKSHVRTIDIQRLVEPSQPDIHIIELGRTIMALIPRLKLRFVILCPPTKYQSGLRYVLIPRQQFNKVLFALVFSVEGQDLDRHTYVVVRSYSPNRPFVFEAIELERCMTLTTYKKEDNPGLDIRSVPADRLQDDLNSLRVSKSQVADHDKKETHFFPVVFDLGEDGFYNLCLKIADQGRSDMEAYMKTHINEWERVHWRPMATANDNE
ncbi:hypothetical protein GGR57DRAFT_290288 [Xylariaceae sp. FL1272]|nr:hypothetical protein GGR57DRAFT_290288 [Xylariaceae sp. FL1272]